MNGIRALFVNRISGQLALLILVSLFAIHVFITASVYLSHRSAPLEPRGNEMEQLATIMKLIAAAPAAEQARLLANATRALPHLHLTQLPALPSSTIAGGRDRRIGFLSHAIGATFILTPLPETTGKTLNLAVTLPDGSIIGARLDPWDEPPRFGGPVAFTVLFIFVSVTLLLLWAARALRGPLSSFAQAAEDFSIDDRSAPLPVRGPEEIRAVARALNRMRERIRALVNDRTRLFAAMSHDLRTPITRLRLRSEFIADAELRGQMLRDLDQMKGMTESVLSYLRDGQAREPESAIDLASGLQTICDEFTDTGHAVSYDGPAHLTCVVRPNELHRAVVNLAANAVRYGTYTRICLREDGPGLTIDVEDDGPGIPASQRRALMEPFARGEDARTMDGRTGFGLGLSIAQAIAKGHGGTLTLQDRAPQGLIARIALPLRSSVH